MGDIADMMLNGDIDSETGEYIGEGDGYPRTLESTAKAERKENKIVLVGDPFPTKEMDRVSELEKVNRKIQSLSQRLKNNIARKAVLENE